MIVTEKQLKQNSRILDNIKKENIVITKQDKPFAVVIDIDKYDEYLKIKAMNSGNAMSDVSENLKIFDELSKKTSAVNKDIDIVKLDEDMNSDLF